MSINQATTLANLLSLAGPFSVGDLAFIAGFQAVGDGGGGEFCFEDLPSSAEITDASPRSVNVSAATDETPIAITTATDHDFFDGQSVLIEGVLGNARANGVWRIRRISDTEFSLNDSAGGGTYTSSGTASIVTITTAGPHGLRTGQAIVVAGVAGIAGVNGTWSEGFVPPTDLTGTTISVPSGATGAYTSGGVIGDPFIAVSSSAAAGRWRRTPIREFKPEFFGAVADDQTKCVENLFAFNQMMIALGPVGESVHGDTVLISQKFYVSDTVHITRPVRWTMKGVGSISGTAQFGPGQITFLPGVSGLALETTSTSSDGGEAENSTLDGVFVGVEVPAIVEARADSAPYTKGQFMSLSAPERADSTHYEIGALSSISSEPRYHLLCIGDGMTAGAEPGSLSTLTPGTTYSDGGVTWLAVVADRYYFLCTVGGTSASTQPSALTSATNGGLYADGGVTWQAILANRDRIRVWLPSTNYVIGDLVRLPYDPRYVFVCTTAGESNTTAPADFIGPKLHQQNIVDALVRWRCDVCAGILVTAPLVKLMDCTSLGFAGMGQHFQGVTTDDPPTNANNCSSDRGRHIDCGGGVLMRGDNCNGNQVTNHDALSLGRDQYGQIGVGYWDRSLAGCLWQNCYTEGGTGAGMIAEATVLGEWNHCFSENYIRSRYTGTCTVLGGGDDYTATAAVKFDRPTGHTQVWTADTQGSVGLRTYMDFQNGATFSGFASDDERNTLYAHVYTGVDYKLAYGNEVPTLAFSGSRSEEGPGHLSIAYGQFVGIGGARHYVGCDPAAYALKSIRGGKRISGDMFVGAIVAPADGDWLYKTVKSAGYAGVPWEDLSDPVTADAFVPHRLCADIVIAPNGSFKCTKAGTRGGVEPIWTDAIAVSTYGARVWRAETEVSDRDVVRATGTGVENAYQLSRDRADYPTWAPDTAFAANAVITPITPNGHYFVNDVVKWTRRTNFLIGMICTPSSPTDPAYGRIYQAITQVSDTSVPLLGGDKFGASGGTTGAKEPTWALDGSFTDDIVAPGSIRWVELHPKTGAPEPKWGKITNVDYADGVLLEGSPLTGELFWRHLHLTTGTAEPTWPHDGDSFKDSPDAKFAGDPGFGIIWVRKGAEGAEPDASVITEVLDGGTAEWSLVDANPVTGVALMWENPNTALEQRAEMVWGEGGTEPSVPTCVRRERRDALETTDGTADIVLASYELDANSMSYLDVTVTAMQHTSGGGTDAPDGAAFKLAAAWFRDAAGAPVERKAPAVAESNPNANGSPWSAVLALNGDFVEVRVTGDAGKTISWNCVRQGIEGR